MKLLLYKTTQYTIDCFWLVIATIEEYIIMSVIFWGSYIQLMLSSLQCSYLLHNWREKQLALILGIVS